MTDLEKNLLYTTKCVPGTLCWFDVYGRELGEILLRVQVDLSRRYWIVYRIGIPSFEGEDSYSFSLLCDQSSIAMVLFLARRWSFLHIFFMYYVFIFARPTGRSRSHGKARQ